MKSMTANWFSSLSCLKSLTMDFSSSVSSRSQPDSAGLLVFSDIFWFSFQIVTTGNADMIIAHFLSNSISFVTKYHFT